MAKGLYEFLQERGLIYQATDPDALKEKLNGEPFTFYLGIDPTADSIHLGHFCSLMTFRRLQEAGHRGILLIGGATAQVGDPSGRSDLRQMLTKEQLHKNFEEVKALCAKYIHADKAIIVNNADWMNKFSYVDFLTQVGRYFTINNMLSMEAYKNRLAEGGLTLMEIGYMPIQANDFSHLNKEYGATMEIGGSDQWGNIVAGVELIRKTTKNNIMAFTTPLLLNSEGKKMGKSAKGAVWIKEEKFSVYDFYQYFINVNDADVPTLLRWFTEIPMAEINKMCSENIIEAKKTAAFLLTKLVHGEEKALQAKKASEEVFNGRGISENMPTVKVPAKELASGIIITDLCVKTKLCPSSSETRRLIDSGAIYVGDDKITDYKQIIKSDKEFVLRKGKKTYLRVIPE